MAGLKKARTRVELRNRVIVLVLEKKRRRRNGVERAESRNIYK
jgi:hypothetical protein